MARILYLDNLNSNGILTSMSNHEDAIPHFFDVLLGRVRNLRAFLSDEEIVTKLVSEKAGTPEQIMLCLHAAKILDG